MDRIIIRDLEVYGKHGVYPEENVLGQKFLFQLVLYTDTRKAGVSDQLEDSVNYGEVCHLVTEIATEKTFHLLEALAEYLAEELLVRYPLVRKVDLEIKKPWAPIGLPLQWAGVGISRQWHLAGIALGSNMGDRKAYLDGAVEALRSRRDCRIRKVSSYLETEPYGGVEQDDFLNGVLEMDTLLSPEELLEVLHQIEQKAGRERKIHWGPRTLDLDILLYDDQIVDCENLQIPHSQMHLRSFVLDPYNSIAPYRRHPLLGKTIRQLAEELKHKT